ncbi:MAG: outer membrane protein OmpA-like peptidoglycan-associated protein [Bacteroidia bacterium]|jgi:outer membrane protein OmpA-like peptidoglycan-associated protein/tetratricopeptide (TPR) repeat protein
MLIKKLYGFVLIIICLFAFDANAQMKYSTKSKRAIKHFEEGLKYYNSRQGSAAIEVLKKAIKADEDFVEAHMVSGDCYADIGDLGNSIIEYQRVVDIDPDFLATSYKQLADAQFKTGDYKSAEGNYRIFMTKKRVNPKIREKAQRSLKNAEFGAIAKESPVLFDPKNLGASVNTDQYEYFPVLTADEQTLVFTRNERRSKANDYQEDFYVSVSKEDGQWSQARNLGQPINTEDNEGAQTITADGSQLFFIGCNRKNGKGSCDIYRSLRKGKKWGVPENLDSPVNSSKWESQPSISADGKTLYFVSNRTGGFGGADIWVTQLAPNNEWTVPRNLGEAINTPFAEETPFIHPDGKTLYFTSNGHVGMGEKDIFMTRMQEDGSWSVPKNLGYPINTWNDEQGLFVAASGENAYFSSDRKGGFGKLDLYSFKLYEAARPTKVTYVKGRVTDKETGSSLGAQFELIDLATSEVVVRSSSDKISGNFLVTLPVAHEYALNVSKDGYLFYSEHFSLSANQDVSKPYKLDVPLQPIKFGETVVLKNIFFETASYDLLPESKVELDKLVAFMNNNTAIRIEIGGHTDNVGKPKDNQLLSENRSKSVREYLIANQISEDRTQFKGYGEEQPRDSNETPEGRANNRRTEFKVLSGE